MTILLRFNSGAEVKASVYLVPLFPLHYTETSTPYEVFVKY